MKWNFDNSYLKLPEDFFSKTNPTPVSQPNLIILNHDLMNDLGLAPLDLAVDLPILAGNSVPAGAQPLAQAYSGHQFGRYNQLGDGRALLIGEHLTPDQKRIDIQLKGSGPTPYSRRGDGRAALGPMLREYIISEAMQALGIPTTRSLAVVATGEPVYRENKLPGAILTRTAASHIRVGTFEYAARLNDFGKLKQLTDYTIARHYPHLLKESANNAGSQLYSQFLTQVCDRQAKLISQWMQVGFIHGVMNTDNMTISGETIDYGPCAFMNRYDPATVFSSIDHQGRYAFGKQHVIGSWNLSSLAQCLMPLLSDDLEQATRLAQESLEHYAVQFENYWLQGMYQKIGIIHSEESDSTLLFSLLELMQKKQVDYTNTFLSLSNEQLPQDDFFNDIEFKNWKTLWTTRLQKQNIPFDELHIKMKSINPAVIPRNHLVEEALSAAAQQNDLSKLNDLLRVLRNPFSVGPNDQLYQQAPHGDENDYQTFCGT